MRRLALIGIVFAAGIVAIGIASCALICPSEVYTRIGEFETKDAALRASIPRLAAEISKCPKAQIYRIVWTGPGLSDRVDRHALLYCRSRIDNSSASVGYEDDVFSGYSNGISSAYVVNDASVRAVAEAGGTLEDFAAYNQRRR